jgi:hypothetical protein
MNWTEAELLEVTNEEVGHLLRDRVTDLLSGSPDTKPFAAIVYPTFGTMPSCAYRV